MWFVRGIPLVGLFAVLVMLSPHGQGEPAKPSEGRPRDPMDLAIDGGLKFLAGSQNPDGSWSAIGLVQLPEIQPGRRPVPGTRTERPQGDVAVTSLAVMAFLSAGHVPGEGPYADRVSAGIRYVMNAQRANGIFNAPLGGEMYYLGVCTLMLAEAIGMTDGALAEEARKRLSAAVAAILAGQRKQGKDAGGWRYLQVGVDADLSVTGWQLMALRAAKNVGCDVPADRIAAAVEYVRRCHEARTGGYMYTTAGPVTVPCTGVGILALELCGKEYHDSDEARKAGSYLLKTPIAVNTQHFFYATYYTSQALFQLGGDYWKAYRPILHKLLLETNPPATDGAWSSRGGWDDNRFGLAYCTAMAVLSLTVEYRFLPIYQRFEEPLETNE